MVCAFAAVAPGVLFNILAIFATPAFCFASALRVRTSSFVHSWRTAVFFVGKSSFLQSQNARFSRCPVQARKRAQRSTLVQRGRPANPGWHRLPASDTSATKRQVRLVRPDLPSLHEHCDLGHFLNDGS